MHTKPSPGTGTLFVVDWEGFPPDALARWQQAVGAPLSDWRVWNIWSPTREGRSPPEEPARIADRRALDGRQADSASPPRSRPGKLRNYFRAARWLVRHGHRWERVVVWQQWIGYLMGLLPAPRGHPRPRLVITTVLKGPSARRWPGWDGLALRLALRRADALVWFSAPMAEAARKAWPRWSSKIHALPLPVVALDNASERVAGSTRTPKASLADPSTASPARPLRVFAGGRSERDFDVVIEALAPTDMTLVLVCDGPVRLREPAGSSPRIEVHRDVPPERFDALARSCDIVVVALRSAASPCGQLLLSFCMRERLALVVSEAAGTRDYVIDGRTGLTVPVGDALALRRACQRLAADPALRQHLLDEAQAFVATLSFASFARAIDALPVGHAVSQSRSR